MTEREDSTKYLSFDDIESVYKIFQKSSLEMDDPIPEWLEVKKTEIENLVNLKILIL